jgi:hypothetical protein
VLRVRARVLVNLFYRSLRGYMGNVAHSFFVCSDRYRGLGTRMSHTICLFFTPRVLSTVARCSCPNNGRTKLNPRVKLYAQRPPSCSAPPLRCEKNWVLLFFRKPPRRGGVARSGFPLWRSVFSRQSAPEAESRFERTRATARM